MSDKESIEVPIKIISFDEPIAIKDFGNLIRSENGRKIIEALLKEPKYKNQIATELNIKYNVTEHHLNKIQELGFTDLSRKQIVKKGVKHNHLEITKQLVIIPIGFSKVELQKKGALRKIFRNGIKFTAIGIAALISSLIFPTDVQFQGDVKDSLIPFTTIPFIIIIIGLSILLILEKKKKMA